MSSFLSRLHILSTETNTTAIIVLTAQVNAIPLQRPTWETSRRPQEISVCKCCSAFILASSFTQPLWEVGWSFNKNQLAAPRQSQVDHYLLLGIFFFWNFLLLVLLSLSHIFGPLKMPLTFVKSQLNSIRLGSLDPCNSQLPIQISCFQNNYSSFVIFENMHCVSHQYSIPSFIYLFYLQAIKSED